jgi:hypothetical protein
MTLPAGKFLGKKHPTSRPLFSECTLHRFIFFMALPLVRCSL